MNNVDKLLQYDRKNKAGEGTSEMEKMYIYSMIRMLQPETVMEIGVSRGHMTAWIAAALADNKFGKCVSVDNWSQTNGGTAPSSSHAMKRLLGNGLQKWVTFVASDSIEYLKDRTTNSFDFIWVDGDHKEEAAYADIMESFRVSSGVVAVHDTNQIADGPKKACLRIEKELGVQGFWVFKPRGIWVANLPVKTGYTGSIQEK